MATEFDPYHKWLGIPPSDQPAHHYRLLGLEPFEEDADVIDSAATQRMSHLRTLQSGPQAALSQRILNEVSAARLTLLDPRKRQAYDTQLRAQLQAMAAPAAILAEGPAPIPQQRAPQINAPRPKTHGPVRRRKSTAWVLPAVLGGGALALLVVGGIVLLIVTQGSKPAPQPIASGGDPQSPVIVKPETPPADTPSPADPNPSPVDPPPTDPIPPEPMVDPPVPVPPTDPLAVNPPPDNPPTDPVTPDPLTPDPPPFTTPQLDPPPKVPAGKPAPPTLAEQQPVQDRLRSVFDFEAATTTEEQGALVEKILNLADDEGVDPIEQYVMLSAAQTLAVRAGDPTGASRAVELLSEHFDVDALELRRQVLLALPDSIKDAKTVTSLVTMSQDFIEDSLRANRVDWGREVADAVYTAATKRGVEVEARKQAYDQKNRLKDLHQQWQQVRDAVANLESTPDDPETNLIAGKWFCFSQQDWQRGLPCLAKGNDDELRSLAQEELTSKESFTDLMSLGERWLKAAASATGDEKTAMRNHAGRFFVLALPLSPPGDATAQQRLASLGNAAAIRDQVILERNPGGRKILFFGFYKSERAAAERGCQRDYMLSEFIERWDKDRTDYSGYHTIIFGTNAMDYFGKEETKAPEAFDPLEAFVKEGGHLVVFGTFNGRNMEHLRRFGVFTGVKHGSTFVRTPASDLFFKGVEHLAPEDGSMRSAGDFRVEQPHTVLLKREDGDRPGVTTQPVEQGRLTFTCVEPSWMNDEWLIEVVISWISHGAPTPEPAPAS